MSGPFDEGNSSNSFSSFIIFFFSNFLSSNWIFFPADLYLNSMDSNLLSLPNSSSTSRWKYDVFLSFRGEDTRYKFTDHLYTALVKRGIVTFRDNENLERGKVISSELLQAIEESRFAIVILSENYACSSWCLDELAKIIECEKEQRMTVLPVFHYVDPTDVWKQTGTFEEAFDTHEMCFKEKRVKTWRYALIHVGNLAGCHLKNIR